MPNFNAQGSLSVSVDAQVEAVNEEEAYDIFASQLEKLSRQLHDLDTSHIELFNNIEFPESCVEHIERIQSTYVSLRSLQSHVREEANKYTSLKDLLSKDD